MKLEGECNRKLMTINLLKGFVSKMPMLFAKYAMASLAVVGNEPDLEIIGCFLWRGLGIPQGLVAHDSAEYYEYRQLDPYSEEDR